MAENALPSVVTAGGGVNTSFCEYRGRISVLKAVVLPCLGYFGTHFVSASHFRITVMIFTAAGLAFSILANQSCEFFSLVAFLVSTQEQLDYFRIQIQTELDALNILRTPRLSRRTIRHEYVEHWLPFLALLLFA